MGNTLSEVLGGKAGEDEKKANDALNALAILAEMRYWIFMSKVRDNKVDTTLISIDKIVMSHHIIKCNIKAGAALIGTEVGKILGNFCKGEILDAISSLSKNVLDLILGNFVANQSENTSYFISAGENGGVYRIDADYYAYQYTSSDLQAVCSDVVSVSVVISSVDTSTIDRNTLRVVISNVFGTVPVEEQKKLFIEIQEAQN